ncbi:hypothetical protein RchiOBHm_Chr5g0019551 [Rosa chinensis]|uniref:Uncharacterized protein n=1 Tax=Rosa chinensis TaxID=74649 RepID=A0A2P6Q714_ROSCH|nr:hypothetical protein RchiOBHm_Chr5g0019551 [Rosa chinensis]
MFFPWSQGEQKVQWIGRIILPPSRWFKEIKRKIAEPDHGEKIKENRLTDLKLKMVGKPWR